jgi:hypothetical protein
LPRSQSGIDQEAEAICFEQGGIPGTAAGQHRKAYAQTIVLYDNSNASFAPPIRTKIVTRNSLRL